jgi:hypothetical protein
MFERAQKEAGACLSEFRLEIDVALTSLEKREIERETYGFWASRLKLESWQMTLTDLARNTRQNFLKVNYSLDSTIPIG